MSELLSGFVIAVAMMTETCHQFKRIDSGTEKRSVDFLLAKFRFKHYTDCNANHHADGNQSEPGQPVPP
jgi:hypothetical protein